MGGTWRIRQENQVLSLSRLMLRAETFNQRTMILKVILVGGNAVTMVTVTMVTSPVCRLQWTMVH